MMLRRLVLSPPATVWTSAALLLLALVGVGISNTSPEAVVTKHFTAALEQAPRVAAETQDRGAQLVAGTEAYWLAERRRHDGQGATLEPVVWAPPLFAGVAVGDRITVSTDGAERVLQVVAISDVEPAQGANGSAATTPAPRQVAITCRDLSAHDGKLVTYLAPAGNVTAQMRRAGRTL